MAKRYHQDGVMKRVKRLEKHEVSEHNVPVSKLGSAFYDGYDNRRREERESGEMIREDRSAIANLPQSVVMREYPRTHGIVTPELDDTMRVVDESNAMDERKSKHERFPSKY